VSRRGKRGPAGILLLDKPVGPTSHDLVGQVRRVTGYRKVGHGGTLDPFASGLLVLGLNSATRLLGYLSAGEKCYLARVHFGHSTDTDDHTGERMANGEIRFGHPELEQALSGFLGDIEQLPPVVSALKVNGERAYAAYRDRAERLELKPRQVSIRQLDIVGFEAPHLDLRVRCGGGTYIRALARDLGEKLGCPAHLSALRRESVGCLAVEDAVDPERFAAGWEAESGPGLLPPLAAVADWPRLQLSLEEVELVRHGGQPAPDWFRREGFEEAPPRTALVDEASRLVALVERSPEGEARLAMVLGEEHGAGLSN